MSGKHFKIFLFSFICLLLIGNCQLSCAKQGKIDSLKTELKKTLPDTTRIKILNDLGWELMYQNPDTSILLGKQALFVLSVIASEERAKQSPTTKYIFQNLTANTNNNFGAYYYLKGDYSTSLSYHFKAYEIRKQLNDKNGIANSLGNLGIVYSSQGDYHKALKYYFEALEIDKELGNKRGMAIRLGNIGIVYIEQGDYPKALQYYFEALEIDKELGNKIGMAISFGNIGNVYANLGDYPQALKNYFEALEIDMELGNKNSIAIRLGNIGNVYGNQSDYPNALKHFFEALEIDIQLEYKIGIASDLSNIGNVYVELGDYLKASKSFFEALEIDKELGRKSGIAIRLGNIGSLYIKQKKYKESEEYLLQASEISKEIGALNILKDNLQNLSTLYTQTQKYALALEHFKKYNETKDSLFNEEKAKDIGKTEAAHEFEMAELQRQQDEVEQARILAEQTERRNQLQYSGIVLVLIGLFIGIFLFARRFRKIKKYKTFRQYTKIVEAALFISFLIFFEFILVVLDPYIEQITGGAPLWKLGFNALLAGVIFPLHSLLETKLKGQVTKTKRRKWVAEAVKGKNLLVIIGLGFVLGLNSGFDKSKIDSLKNAIATAVDDTTKINSLNQLSKQLITTKPDTAIEFAKQALELSNTLEYIKGQIASYHNIGYVNYVQSDYEEAIANWQKTLELREQQNDLKGMASSYNNIGNIYDYQSNYPQALDYYFKALKIDKELGNKQGIAASYTNIGVIYENQSSYHQALSYYFKAIKIYEELGDKLTALANTYNNIGVIYDNQSSYPQALSYYFKAIKIYEELGNKLGMATSYTNIGNVYIHLFEQGDSLERSDVWVSRNTTKLLDTAMYYQQKALTIDLELGDEYGMTYDFYGIASILKIKGEYNQALEYYLQTALLADSIGALDEESEAHSGMSKCYEQLGNHKLALKHYKQYSTLKDSIFNEEKSKDLGKLEAKHEFEMAELQKKQQEEKWAKVVAERISRRNDLQHSAILIGIFILFGSLFLLGKLSIPNWLVELSVFIPFLILFEFLLVLLDPSIESWTDNAPAIKLLFNAALAGMMFPLHQFFEGKLKKRIVNAQRLKLNKRMEQFKRDVEKL